MIDASSVQFAYQDNNNAPQLQNAVGSMVGLLDAVLVTGYGLQTVGTLAADDGGILTATFNAAHGFKSGQILLIAGASDAEFNGRFRVDEVINSNSLKFTTQISGAKTAVGTITAKVAPLGYEIAFTDGAYRRAYKSLNPDNVMYYIFDDNVLAGWSGAYAKICNVGLALEMTDINTITGLQCPFDPANPNLNWQVEGAGSSAICGWAKLVYGCWNQGNGSYFTSTSNADHIWSVVGNDEGFYICVMAGADTNNKIGTAYYFGKYQSYSENSFNYLLCANMKRAGASEYQDNNSYLLNGEVSLSSVRLDCKMFASSDGSVLTVSVCPVLPRVGGQITNKPDPDSHYFDDSTGVSLLNIPFLSQQSNQVEGNLPFVFAALQHRPLVARQMGIYTQKTFKHANGNYFVELNVLGQIIGYPYSYFFELRD